MLMVPLPAADPVSILECPLVSSGARLSYSLFLWLLCLIVQVAHIPALSFVLPTVVGAG